MASVIYKGTFDGAPGDGGAVATSSQIVGSPLPSDATITSVQYTLKISATNYSTSRSWVMSVFCVGGEGGDPWASSEAPMVSSSHTFSGDMEFTQADALQFRGTQITVYADAYTTHSSTGLLYDFSVTVNYEVYTRTTAPNRIEASPANAAPGARVTLTWSGATGGDGNPIAGYNIWRASDPAGPYSSLTTVASTASSGSTTVVAPTTNGASYYYKITTIGAISGYGSAMSGVHATLTCAYAAVGAPTSLQLSLTNVAPGAEATLSWSGASAGDNNAITGYAVYRALAEDGEYTVLTVVTGSATSGETTVTAPTNSGTTYYYKVQTKGTLVDQDSPLSSAYVSLTCTYSSPSAPTEVLIEGGLVTYSRPGASTVLTWAGATGGANNPIKGYAIYRDNELFVDGLSSSTTSRTVTAHDAAGESYRYTVVTKGAYSDSAPSAACELRSYSDPTAPSTLTASNEVPVAGTRVLLSWSGALPGGYNGIVGYRVYRSNAQDGEYTQVALVSSTETAYSCYVASPPVVGSYYYFRVETTGTYSASGMSDVCIAIGAREAEDGENDKVEVIVPLAAPRKKRGFVFGDYDTGFKGWTLTGWGFPEPKTQTNYVDVPGRMKGKLDQSTALTDGDPRYTSRELTATFECSDGTRPERNALISEMVNRLHGMRENIVFPDDQSRYAVGRLHIETEYSDMAHAAITVTATCEPWLYNVEETHVRLLVTDDIATTVLSNSGRCIVVPDVVVAGYGARVYLTSGDRTWTLNAGAYKLPDLAIARGNTVLTYHGSGTVSITYREAII